MRTHQKPLYNRKSKIYSFYASWPDLWLTFISSNYSCLEHIFMVRRVFEPLKFYCNYKLYLMHKHILKKITIFANKTLIFRLFPLIQCVLNTVSMLILTKQFVSMFQRCFLSLVEAFFCWFPASSFQAWLTPVSTGIQISTEMTSKVCLL